MLLDKIEKANDIKKIDKSDYGELAEEIRQFLIQKISVTGGHLGSNLGAVELTMALHLALNLPEDELNKIVAFLETLTGEYKGKPLTNDNQTKAL